MEPSNEAVAQKVAAAMAAAGHTTRSISVEAGIPRVTLQRRLRGVSPFLISELGRIAKVLGVKTSDLLPEEVDAA